MGLFGFFKRKDPIQEYLDGFFKNLAIVDVVDASDIPIVKINGNDGQRMPADIFFSDHTKISPHRIDSHDQDSDVILWIFDTFFVFETNATKKDTKQFIVMKLVNLQHGYDEQDGLRNRLDDMESSYAILGLKEQLRHIPPMEIFVFKEACNFFAKNHNQAVVILKKKYT